MKFLRVYREMQIHSDVEGRAMLLPITGKMVVSITDDYELRIKIDDGMSYIVMESFEDIERALAKGQALDSDVIDPRDPRLNKSGTPCRC